MKDAESTAKALGELYSSFGCRRFKMSKFEEYDLYVSNKSFLLSENILTFTDTDGRLMALKPDVTLSIVKNCREIPGKTEKIYYNENVYRPDKTTGSFREIKQTGLEYIGEIDDRRLCEVVYLAAESLALISPEYALDVSNLDLLGYALDKSVADGVDRAAVLRCISAKNPHGISELCGDNAEKLIALTSLEGGAEIFPDLRALYDGEEWKNAVGRFESIITALSDKNVRVDFSVINDMSYYNGIVWSGFVNGIASAALSGGQYDLLMKKMNRRSGAVGFAVYVDLLEQILPEAREGGEDIGSACESLTEFVEALREHRAKTKV